MPEAAGERSWGPSQLLTEVDGLADGAGAGDSAHGSGGRSSPDFGTLGRGLTPPRVSRPPCPVVNDTDS